MVRDYWRAIHRKAFAETGVLLKLDSRAHVMIGCVGLIAILGCLAFWGSADASRDEAITRLAIAGAVIGLFPFIYLWKLVEVPARLHEAAAGPFSLASSDFDFGNTESKIEVLDAGENFGGVQQYFRLWCPIKFKRKAEAVTVRISVLRPLQPLDIHPPQYSWKPIEKATFFEGDIADIVFACVPRNRQQNGYYGDMRKDAMYIGGISRHLFEIDVLIGSKRTTKHIYFEGVAPEAYHISPRGFGRFGNQFFLLEDGADLFDSEWIAQSRDAVAGKISLPIGSASEHRGGFGMLGF